MKYDVIVCGSGPGGISAALSAAQAGASVLLVERLGNFSVKLRASGGTRCNLSNAAAEKEFMEAFGRNGRFMADALHFAPREKIFDFLSENGVKIIAEDSFHFFPASGRASDISDAFLNTARRYGAELRSNAEIESLIMEPGCLRGAVISGEKYDCGALVLACGGTAAGRLGGTDSGLRLAESAGHSIVLPLPAMAPLYVQEDWIKKLSGVSLPDAGLSFSAGRIKYRTRGELLFTHDGLSGPAAIDISGAAAQEFHDSGNVVLSMCLDAKIDFHQWCAFFDKRRSEYPKKMLRNTPGFPFAHSILESICAQFGMSEITCSEMSHAQRDAFAHFLTGAPVQLSGISPMEKAMAMKGGINLKEVNPKTMESRLLKNLFFAGEILNLDGPCGGYNIQFALSGGSLAGYCAAESCKS